MLADPTQRPPLPLATKRDRQVHVPTSYTEGTTPEQALAVAVILQAISDLQSKDEQERFEAHEFFLQPKGPWADMRRFYFQAVRLDDEWLHEHLSARLEPPERPDKKWSYHEIGDALPTDRSFTSGDLAKITGLPTGKLTSKLQILREQGRVVRLEVGRYCVPEYEDTWRARQAAAIEAGKPKHTPFAGFDAPVQEQVLDALRNGRETVREVGFDVPSANVRETLDTLVARGVVEKDGPKYRIVQDAAA